MSYQQGKIVGKRHAAWLWRRKWWLAGACFVLVMLIVAPSVYVHLSTRHQRFTQISQIAPHEVAIVFGAGVYPDGTPTPYLQRRIETAADLYKAGKARVLLLSGDNSSSHHNEPIAMRAYAEKLGVPASRIVLDYAGFNTYDSCYRAAVIFNVHSAILVSHAYHLPRAIMTCEHLGVRSVGMAAENAGQVGRDFSVNYLIRELGSTDKAMLQIVFKPHPTVLGAPEPIKSL